MSSVPGDYPRYLTAIDAIVPSYAPPLRDTVIIGGQTLYVDAQIAAFGAAKWTLLGMRPDGVLTRCIKGATDGSDTPVGFLASYIDASGLIDNHGLSVGDLITVSLIVRASYNVSAFNESCIDPSWGVGLASRVQAVIPLLHQLRLFASAAPELGATGTIGTAQTGELEGYSEVEVTLNGGRSCFYVLRDVAVEMIVDTGQHLLLPTRTAAWLISVGLVKAV